MLLVEEHARLAVDHRIQRAAGGVGPHRPAGGGRLQRRDAKILFAGKNERPAAFEIAPLGGVVDRPEELDVRAGQTLQPRAVASVADDLQRRVEPGARLDGQVDALVGDQARNDEKIALVLGAAAVVGVGRRLDGREDHRGVPPVELLDPPQREG